MFITGFPTEGLNRTADSKLVLRNGQIALGKVTKIYPNNRAAVQIGSHRFIAQIETPLAVGEGYIFRIEQKNDQLLQLRVLGHETTDISQKQIQALLRQFNLPVNMTNIQFVQALFDAAIPFSQKELQDALQVINRLGDSSKMQLLLKQMMSQKIPISENIVRALLTFQESNLSSPLRNALQTLHNLPQTEEVAKLKSLITSMVQRPGLAVLQSLPARELSSIIESLQLFKLVPSKGMKHDLASSATGTGIKQASIQQLLQALQRSSTYDSHSKSMKHLIEQYQSLQHRANHLIHEFSLIDTSGLTKDQFTQLTQRMINDLIPLLPKEQQVIVRNILQSNQSQSLPLIQSMLHSLSSNHFYSLLLESLVTEDERKVMPQNESGNFIQQRFLLHTAQLLQSLGLSHESMIKNMTNQFENLPFHPFNVNNTIKAMLLNFIQEDRTTLENFQQLVHYINGMQLQTREEGNMIHIQLQVPGEKIGLPEDLMLTFEGRKKENDEIDIDFCRILFFLHLYHIEETIIDMNIQKRVISLTVYNADHQTLTEKAKSLRGPLEQALSTINYRLSTVRFKPLEEDDRKRVKEQEPIQQSPSSHEGFDLRI